MNQVTKSLTADEIAAFEKRASMVAATSTPAIESKSEATFVLTDEGTVPIPVANFLKTADRVKVVTLEWPLELRGGTVLDKVEIRRLTGRNFRALAEMPAGTDENSYLISMMTGLALGVIDSLDADDFATLNEACRDFLPRAILAEAAQASATGEATPQ